MYPPPGSSALNALTLVFFAAEMSLYREFGLCDDRATFKPFHARICVSINKTVVWCKETPFQWFFHAKLGWPNYCTCFLVTVMLCSVCRYPLCLMKAEFPQGDHNLVLTHIPFIHDQVKSMVEYS